MYYIGLDIGSSSVKVALVEAVTGKCIGSLHEPPNEMKIQAPEQDWAEQDPDLWWTYVCKAIQRIIKETKIASEKIQAIGISYQMHGLVVVDKDGNSIRPSIIWCDSRAVEIGKKAYAQLGHEYCATHLLNAPGNFTASKLKWVRDHEPDVYERIHKFMLPGDYIAYKLTGEITTTPNGLSEGTLWDYAQEGVATRLLDHYAIDPDLTPDLVDNFKDQGKVHAQASQETGLPKGISITYRSGDQPNNALALNVLKPGQVAVTGGTSGVIYAVTNGLKFDEIHKVNQFAHVNYTEEHPVVGRLLNINGAGIQYRWLKQSTAATSYDYMNKKAAEVAIGANGLVVLPFGNGAERMFDNRTIGTQIAHLNLNQHQNGHLYRATLEGIAFAFVYGMRLLKRDHTHIEVIRAGDDNLFRSAIFSDTVATLIGQEIEMYHTTGAIGAARAAGITDADFDHFEASNSSNDHVHTYVPLANSNAYEEAYQRWKKQLEINLRKT